MKHQTKFTAWLMAITIALGLAGCVTSGSSKVVRYTCASSAGALRVLAPIHLSQADAKKVSEAGHKLEPICGRETEPTAAELQDAAVQSAIGTLVELATKYEEK